MQVGLSVSPEHYDMGWHITSTTGSIGAAISVGKLLGLSTTHMQHTIGIAATQVVGMQVYFGSDTKSLHVGRAAQGGILAALLAKNGYTSSLEALEAKHGWPHVISTRGNATLYFDQLGKIWEIEKNTFKPYPCGIIMHPTIDAAIYLRNEAILQSLSIEDIDTVQLRVSPEVLILTGKKEPQIGLEGKFSIYHAAALGLVYGKATPSQFTDSVVKDLAVISVRNKVNATEDEGVSRSEAYVTLTFKDGTTLQRHIEHAKGSIQNPLTEEELKEKFIGQVSLTIGPDRAQDAYASFSNVQEMSDVAAVRHISIQRSEIYLDCDQRRDYQVTLAIRLETWPLMILVLSHHASAAYIGAVYLQEILTNRINFEVILSMFMHCCIYSYLSSPLGFMFISLGYCFTAPILSSTLQLNQSTLMFHKSNNSI